MLSGMRATSAGSTSRTMPRSRRISTKREPSTASDPHGLIDRASGFTRAQRFIAQTADAVRAAAIGGDPGEQAGRQPLQHCHLAGVQHAGQLLDPPLPAPDYPQRPPPPPLGPPPRARGNSGLITGRALPAEAGPPGEPSGAGLAAPDPGIRTARPRRQSGPPQTDGGAPRYSASPDYPLRAAAARRIVVA